MVNQAEIPDFSEDVFLGINAVKMAVLGALFERHSVVSLIASGKIQGAMTFARLKEDGTIVTHGDFVSTVECINPFVQKYGPPLKVISEEKLTDWSVLSANILADEDHAQILSASRGLIIDGIDNTVAYNLGKEGCGVQLNGLKNGRLVWAIFASLPTALDAACGTCEGFIMAAEIGKGCWLHAPSHGWKRTFVSNWLTDQSPLISLGTYHDGDSRYDGIREWFMAMNSDYKKITGIGHACAEVCGLGGLHLYLHGQLALHDRAGTEVFVTEAGGLLYKFLVDEDGKFIPFDQGFGSDYVDAKGRIGVLFGHPDLVNGIASFMEESGQYPPPLSFFAKAGAAH